MISVRRSILTAVATAALGTTVLAAPAQADPASGGNYASSVATKTTAYFNNNPGRSITLRSFVYSTSSASGDVHGTVTWSVHRAASSSRVAFVRRPISGPSGTLVTFTGTFPATVPKGVLVVTAIFEPASQHIEKSSGGSGSNTYYPG